MIRLWQNLEKSLLVFLPAILILICSCAANAQQHNALAYKIDSLVQLKSPKTFNGVIVIAQAGNIKYEHAYGFADIENNKPLTINTQFGAGSVCKQFTAVLVLQEMERGHLLLDDRIGKYLPQLDASWKDSVTIRQLLQHTSGVLMPGAPLAFTPGSACLYSNYGYQLLGKIVERTSGKSFCKLASALFLKSHMPHTVDPVLCAGVHAVKNMANGYLVQPDGKPQATDSMIQLLYRTGEASGGIISTAKDLVSWNESLHGGKLLHDSTYRMMFQPSGKVRQHPVFGEITYGFSFPLPLHSDIQMICHSGLVGGSGFYCINFYYPRSKTSVVVMENIGNESIPTTDLFFFQTAIARMVEKCLSIK